MASTKAVLLPQIIGRVTVALMEVTSTLLILWNSRPMVRHRAGPKVLFLVAFQVVPNPLNRLMVSHLMDRAINTRLGRPEEGMVTRAFAFLKTFMMCWCSWKSWTATGNGLRAS
jgi:hypothetical protein